MTSEGRDEATTRPFDQFASSDGVAPETPPRRTGRSPRASTRGLDAVTSVEREAAPAASRRTTTIEAEARREHPEQLALVDPAPRGETGPLLTGIPALDRTSSLPLARTWYRRELEQAGRPRNTVDSYGYDLQAFETMIGVMPIHRIDRADVARFLGEAETRSTRKRRLTTVRRFFRYLIDDARVLKVDPTEGFYPHQIDLRMPVPLFPDEEEALVAAARNDSPWAALSIHLMLRLGLTRGELLTLRADHIDRSDPERPVVFVGFDSRAKRGLERRMAGSPDLLDLLDAHLDAAEPVDLVFTVGPPAVNAMVDRVRKRAGLTKTVTPQTLRYTYAVRQARMGADASQLLDLLGLVDDPRNRASVDRYLRIAAPPLQSRGAAGRAEPLTLDRSARPTAPAGSTSASASARDPSHDPSIDDDEERGHGQS